MKTYAPDVSTLSTKRIAMEIAYYFNLDAVGGLGPCDVDRWKELEDEYETREDT